MKLSQIRRRIDIIQTVFIPLLRTDDTDFLLFSINYYENMSKNIYQSRHQFFFVSSVLKIGLDQTRPTNVYKTLPISNLMNMHGKLLNAPQITDLIQRVLCTCIHVYMYVCYTCTCVSHQPFFKNPYTLY
jgi:hypothetical protein